MTSASPDAPPSVPFLLPSFSQSSPSFKVILYITIYHSAMYVHLFLYPFTLLLLIFNRSDNVVVVLVLALTAMICVMTITWGCIIAWWIE